MKYPYIHKIFLGNADSGRRGELGPIKEQYDIVANV